MSDKLTQVRAQLPAVEHIAFLNTGTCGPLPAVAAEAMRQTAEQEFTHGRASVKRYAQMREDGQAARAQFGELLHVPPESIALTGHTTEGMNIATFGFNWQPGDEAVTTTLEHEAGLYPLYFIASRYGVKINFATLALNEDPLPAIEAAITPRTRLVSISHVSYSSGVRLPLAEIVAAAHARGVPVLVDGAQAAGVFDLDLTAIGVDFYALPGQKWLCGPEGTGALYVSPAQWDNLQPTYAGFTSIERQDWQGGYTLAPAALRYELGTKYPPTIAGLRASLDWFLHDVGPDWAYDAHRRADRLHPPDDRRPGRRARPDARQPDGLAGQLPAGGLVAAAHGRGGGSADAARHRDPQHPAPALLPARGVRLLQYRGGNRRPGRGPARGPGRRAGGRDHPGLGAGL